MLQGTVKKWIAERGFGFVVRADGFGDLFLHIDQVEDDVDELRVGDRVSFELAPGRDGKQQAVNAKLIGKAPAQPARYGDAP